MSDSSIPAFSVTDKSEQLAFKLLDRYPISQKELLDAENSTNIKQISKFRINVDLALTKNIRVKNDYLLHQKNLPIFKYRPNIIQAIDMNKVMILVAETGSGKTTQVPQYIMEEAARKHRKCRILCIQTRRISAISAAKRVAFELDEPIGTTVGYQIRLEGHLSANSNLIYCTNDVALRCLMGDDSKEFFGNITHIIIDEVHERNALTDFLLISIKEYMHLNTNLKVILMSGTVEVDSFSQYFNDCAVMEIPGKLFDVRVCYLDEVLRLTNSTNRSAVDVCLDHDLIIKLIHHIHFSNSENRNAILVFLPGYEDIIQLLNMMNGKSGQPRDCKVFLLHDEMDIYDQEMVFMPLDFGQRKIILSTNIAETSITIEEVVFVIDCGREKQIFDLTSHSSSLQSTWISKSSSKQRAGRAGRVQNGFCYRIYSEDRFNHMPDYTVPDILRIPLTEISLQAKLLTSKDMNIEEFLLKAVTPPPQINIKQSIKLLKNLEALDENENLTQLGVILADLPVNVHLGKMLVYSIIFKCVDPVLTIVSTLFVQDPFVLPTQEEEIDKFYKANIQAAENSFSDHYLLLKGAQNWNEFKLGNSTDEAYCSANYINGGLMERIFAARAQIIGQMRTIGIIPQKGIQHLNENSEKWFVVKACLAAGLYPNVVRINEHELKSQNDKEFLEIYKNSLLREKLQNSSFKALPSQYFVYGEKGRSDSDYGNQCKYNTLVHPVVLILMCGNYKIDYGNSNINLSSLSFQQGLCTVSIDDLLRFTVTIKCGFMLGELRKKFRITLFKFLRDPQNVLADQSEDVRFSVEAIVKLLENEEKAVGFKIDFGEIGVRPRKLTLRQSSDTSPDDSSSNEGGEYSQRSDTRKPQIWINSRQTEDQDNVWRVDQSKSQPELPKKQRNFQKFPEMNFYQNRTQFMPKQPIGFAKNPMPNIDVNFLAAMLYGQLNYNSYSRQRNENHRYFVIVLQSYQEICRLTTDTFVPIQNIDKALMYPLSQYDGTKNYHLFFMSSSDNTLYASGILVYFNRVLCCKFLKNTSINIINHLRGHRFVEALLRDVYVFGKKWIEIPEVIGQRFLF